MTSMINTGMPQEPQNRIVRQRSQPMIPGIQRSGRRAHQLRHRTGVRTANGIHPTELSAHLGRQEMIECLLHPPVENSVDLLRPLRGRIDRSLHAQQIEHRRDQTTSTRNGIVPPVQIVTGVEVLDVGRNPLVQDRPIVRSQDVVRAGVPRKFRLRLVENCLHVNGGQIPGRTHRFKVSQLPFRKFRRQLVGISEFRQPILDPPNVLTDGSVGFLDGIGPLLQQPDGFDVPLFVPSVHDRTALRHPVLEVVDKRLDFRQLVAEVFGVCGEPLLNVVELFDCSGQRRRQLCLPPSLRDAIAGNPQ